LALWLKKASQTLILGGWRSEAGGEDELCEEEEQDVPFVGDTSRTKSLEHF